MLEHREQMRIHSIHGAERNRFLSYVCHLAVLAVAALTLAAFLIPMKGSHGGIDSHSRARFADMVAGTAYKPFVYRTLLPVATRMIATITPTQIQLDTRRFVQEHPLVHTAFDTLGWNTDVAYQYLVA